MGLLSNRGLCRARQGQWRNAWLDHDRALAVAPSMHSRTLHYFNRGLCAMRLGMLEEAHEDMETAAEHGTTGSVQSGAERQLRMIDGPLTEAYERQFVFLRQTYPSLMRSRHCASVQAFRDLCKQVRERLGRERPASAKRYDICTVVHKEALSTIAREEEFDSAAMVEGAHAAFITAKKELTRQLLARLAQEEAGGDAEPGLNLNAGGGAGDKGGNGRARPTTAPPATTETLHETDVRLASENRERWATQQAAMVGNDKDGMVLVRDTDKLYAIAHRARCGRPATAPPSRASSATAGDVSQSFEVSGVSAQRSRPMSAAPLSSVSVATLETTIRRSRARSAHRERAAAAAAPPPPPVRAVIGGVAIESMEEQQARERRLQKCQRETSRRLSRRGVGAAALPCDLSLHDSRSYRSKLRGQGRLHTGRVERVRKTLPAKPSVQALKAVTGDWSSAAAAAHFFNKAGGNGEVNWEAWNRELSWRCEVEAGPAMVATGRNAAALAAGRSAVSV